MKGVSRIGRPNAVLFQAVGKLARACPKCGAKPGHRCFRMIKGTGTQVPITTTHDERKVKRGPRGGGEK